MKFKNLIVILGVLMVGCSKLPQPGDGNSFKAQLTELVQMKDAGLISEEEYRTSRKSLLHRMIH